MGRGPHRSRRLIAALLLALLLTTACAAEPPPAARPISVTLPDATGYGRAGDLVYLEEIMGDAQPTARLPMLVLIHGRGDKPAHGWLRFAAPRPLRVIMPQAPLRFGGGFSWSHARVSETTGENAAELARDLSERADQIADTIEILRKQRPTEGLPLAAGFSQGGMLSFTLAVRHPHAFRALMPISGLLPEALFPKAAPSAPLPPIRALHGTTDPLVPITGARAAIDHLAQTGYKAELREFENVPHTISPAMLEAFNAWLGSSLKN
jgi:phospholipase/carboxylesterase